MNVAKTKLMVLCIDKKKHLEDQVQVNIGDTILLKHDAFKVLLHVNKQQSWKVHACMHIGNVGRVTGMLLKSCCYQARGQNLMSIFLCK